MIDSTQTLEKIRTILQKEFSPLEMQLEDQSHFHKGHRQAGGGGHFFVVLSSEKFRGLSPLARQRLVLDSVKELMDKEIHALSMKLISP